MASASRVCEKEFAQDTNNALKTTKSQRRNQGRDISVLKLKRYLGRNILNGAERLVTLAVGTGVAPASTQPKKLPLVSFSVLET